MHADVSTWQLVTSATLPQPGRLVELRALGSEATINCSADALCRIMREFGSTLVVLEWRYKEGER